MQSRPWQFNFLILVYLGIILSFPLQILYILNLDNFNVIESLNYLTPLNWGVIILCALQIFLLHRSERVLLYTIPLCGFVVIANNVVVAQFSNVFSVEQVLLPVGLFLMMHVVLLMKMPKQMFAFPRSRWWLTAKRKVVKTPVELILPNGSTVSGESVDISSSGIYVRAQVEELRQMVGERITLTVGKNKIKFSSKIIRCEEKDSYKPEGVGIQFMNSNLLNGLKQYSINY